MMRTVKRHMWYYVSLSFILLAAVILVMQAKDSATQMLAVVMAGFFYCVWGVAHHYREHDVSAKIVVEYVLISSLGITAIYFLLRML